MNHYVELEDYAAMQKVVDFYLSKRLPLRPALFNVLLKRHQKEENAEAALKTIKQMLKSNLMPNRTSFRIATKALFNDFKSGLELLDLAKSMGKAPDAFQYVTLVKGNGQQKSKLVNESQT